LKHYFISIAVGVIAGTIDIIPMIIKKLDIMFILSAFSMWIFASLLTSACRFTSIHWLNGIITALMLFIPLLFLIIRLDKTALPQVIITTLLLGSAIGVSNYLLIK